MNEIKQLTGTGIFFGLILVLVYFHIPNLYFIKNTFGFGVTPLILLFIIFSRYFKVEIFDLLLILAMFLFLNIAFFFKDDFRGFLANSSYLVLYLYVYSYYKKIGVNSAINFVLVFGALIGFTSLYLHIDPYYYQELISLLEIQEGFRTDDEAGLGVIFTSTIPYINPNTFGYMFLPLIVLSYGSLKRSDKWSSVVLVIGFMLIVLLTFSKGVTATLALSYLVLAFRGHTSQKELLLTLALILLMINFGLLEPLWNKILAVFGETDVTIGSSSGRLEGMIYSLETLDTNSLFGTNDGSFRSEEYERFGFNEHNFFLSSLQWNGFFYTLTFLILNGVIIFRTLKASNLMKNNGLKNEKLSLDCFLAILLGQLFSLNFGPPYAYHWIMMALASAAASNCSKIVISSYQSTNIKSVDEIRKS